MRHHPPQCLEDSLSPLLDRTHVADLRVSDQDGRVIGTEFLPVVVDPHDRPGTAQENSQATGIAIAGPI